MSVARYRLGLVLVAASAIAWSTAGYFTRLIHKDAWTMLAWRGLFGGLGVALAILLIERRDASKAFLTMSRSSWLFVVVSALGMVLFIASLRHTTVAHVAVIYALAPFVAAALGALALGETPSKGSLVASLLALLGVALMVGWGFDGGLFGDALAFGMTLCMAAMMVIARRLGGVSALPAACLSALLSGIACWPFADPLAVSGRELLFLALFGLVNSALGLTLFTFGARWLPPIETALIGALDAPLAPLWVWLAFGETPGLGTLAGGLLVFAVVVAHILSETGPRMPSADTKTREL